MSKLKDIVFYIPFGVNLPKRKCVDIGVWIVTSILFFCFILTDLQGDAREIYLFYLGGILPMLVAFQDKEYVIKEIKREFSSLMYALYRQNIIFYLMFLLLAICTIKDFELLLLNIFVTTLWWSMSVPLSIIYNRKKWYIYSLFVLFMNCLFVYWITHFEIEFHFVIIVLLPIVVGSFFFSKKLVNKLKWQ